MHSPSPANPNSLRHLSPSAIPQTLPLVAGAERGSPPIRRRLDEAPASPRRPTALADDLLEEILIRVASHADLARASTACVAFRRLVTDPTFLRRYRSLHPLLLLGFLPQGFDPVEAPHPNAPVASAFARAAGFFFDYLPPGRWGRWHPCDIRDGRVLLKCSPPHYDGFVFSDFAVCDLLSRLYLLLPAILCEEPKIRSFKAFLVLSGDWEETSFRVVGVMDCTTKLMVFNFSSISGCWSVTASTSLDALSLDKAPTTLAWPDYAYGCFYWIVPWLNKLLKLDMNKMEFSTVDIPPSHHMLGFSIMEAGEGRLGMFSHNVHDTYVYYHTTTLNESERTSNWQMKNRIPLPSSFKGRIFGAAEGYIFLFRIQGLQDMAAYFALEIKTSEIKRVSTIRFPIHNFCPYFGFPPSMSPRRI